MNKLPENQIITGDCLEVMKDWPDNCVDLVVTSPPYWQAMVYGNETIGRESDPIDYIDNIVSVFRTIKRILKNSGSVYLNIGDVYYGDKGFHRCKGRAFRKTQHHYEKHINNKGKLPEDFRWRQRKQLLMLPDRVAIKMQDEGWILRNKIIWHKTNAQPVPTHDRRMPYYETVFFFVKQQKYYYNKQYLKHYNKDIVQVPINGFGDHQASYPAKLIYPFVSASCPRWGIVLDPFNGSGTTIAVAQANQKKYIGIDISEEYCEIARQRLEAVDTGVPVKEQRKGQGALFK